MRKKTEDSIVLTQTIPVVQPGGGEEGPRSGDVRNAIKFEPEKIICEDENVKIAILSFAEEWYNWGEGGKTPQFEAVVSCKVYNKTTSDEIYVAATDMYVMDEGLGVEMCIYGGGYIKPGKSQVGDFLVQKNTAVGTESKAFSCEDLYNLEGVFEVRFPDNYSANYEIPFNFSDLK